MRINPIPHNGTLKVKKAPSFPVKVEEPKKEIPQPIVEEVEDKELVNLDDGEGEG